MMCELISLNPNHIVSVEAFDDVAIETGNGTIAEQIKSVQSQNNPLSNRAEVFWKTLYNWLSYIKNGSLSLDNTVFRMVVIANKSLNVGDIIKPMFDAKSDLDAESALLSAKTTLWGEDGIKKAEVPESYAAYLNEIFKLSNKTNVIAIIKRMELEIYVDDYDEKLYSKFCAQPIDDRFHEKLFLTMLGWVNERVNTFLQAKQTAFIKCKEFRDELVKHTKACNENALLAAASVSPTQDETVSELEKQDIYIRQLGLIELDISGKLEAASDYLRTRSTKIAWAEQGIVNQQNIDNYNQSLIRNWNLNRVSSELLRGYSVVEIGKKLYSDCQLSAQNVRIQGGDPPEYFGSGTLHSLANTPSNQPQIGWHPQYKTLLKSKEVEDEE